MGWTPGRPKRLAAEERLGSVVLSIRGGFHGEWGGDDLAAVEPELAPQPVGASLLEVNVHGQVGSERGAGEREDRVAVAVADVVVLVGEGLPVGAHDDY